MLLRTITLNFYFQVNRHKKHKRNFLSSKHEDYCCLSFGNPRCFRCIKSFLNQVFQNLVVCRVQFCHLRFLHYFFRINLSNQPLNSEVSIKKHYYLLLLTYFRVIELLFLQSRHNTVTNRQ